MRETGAWARLCANHVDAGGRWHPHVWRVEVWILDDGSNAEDLRDELDRLLSQWDHGQLPPELARGEALSDFIKQSIPGCREVELSREERLLARAT